MAESLGAPRRVVVVGGGITGLTAAFRLAEAADRDAKLDIQLLETSERLGGQIRTERIDGFLVEGGPDTFLVRKQEGVALCRELGIADRLVCTNSEYRRSFVLRRGKLHRLPEGMSGLVPTQLGPLLLSGVLSPLGRLRAAADLFIRRPPETVEESVAAFTRRRLGREAYDYLVEPLLCGIHAGDGERLSLDATTPLLRDIEEEHGSLLRGLRRRGSSPGADADKFATPFVSLAGGMQELVDALVARLGPVRLRTGTEALNISQRDDLYRVRLRDGEEIDATAVVIAVPAHAAAELVQSLHTGLTAALREIPFVSNAAVSMGFRVEDVCRPLEGYGYVVPRREGRRALACSWGSTKLAGRAPEGMALMRVFLGRAGDEVDAACDDPSLVAAALDEVRATIGISGEPLFTRVFRYPRGMPQYTLGHEDRVERIRRLAADLPGISLTGNSYRGVGIPDCIRGGQRAAYRALRHVQSTAGA